MKPNKLELSSVDGYWVSGTTMPHRLKIDCNI